MTRAEALSVFRMVTTKGRDFMRTIYGPHGDCFWRVRDGGVEWCDGYRSEYGFHIKGRKGTLREALNEAAKARIYSDPCPGRPDLPPAGTFGHNVSTR